MNTRWLTLWLMSALMSAALWLTGSIARADTPQQSTVTVTADATVRVELMRGTVAVVGSSKNEVSVRTHAGDVSVETSDGGAHVSIRGRIDATATVEVSVPIGASVEVRTIEAAVTVRGVSGHVQVQGVQGDIDVSGASSDVEARNVSGAVRLVLARADVRASSVDGAIDVHIPGGGTVALRNISGTTRVEGARLTRLEAHSVSGDLGLFIDLIGSGPFVARTHSGDVRIVLPKASATTVDAHSSRGEVNGADGGVPSSPDAPRPELTVYTFSGAVDVTRK